jgi:hypothetical protein
MRLPRHRILPDGVAEVGQTLAREAALAAGAVAHKGFAEASLETLQTQQKAGFFDIVTASDKAAEAAACGIVRSRLPASRILVSLRRAVDLLANARRIDVYGYGGSGFLAGEAQHRLAPRSALRAWPMPTRPCRWSPPRG